jgi:hypothetical protein
LHYGTGSNDGTKYKHDYNRWVSQSAGNSYSSSDAEAAYMDDENESLARLRYAGSRLTAPGVNVASGYAALSYEPVVQIFVTNPNQVIYTEAPDQSSGENPGNVLIDRGPQTIINRPARPDVSYVYQSPGYGGPTALR